MLSKKQEFKGYWHIPGKNNKPIPGTLIYCPNESIRLELIGNFFTGEEDIHMINFLFTKSIYPIIHGEVSDGKMVTLIDCTRGRSSRSYSCSFPLVSYKVEIFLLGTLLFSQEERKFSRFEIDLPLLFEWVNYIPTNYSIPFDKEGHMNTFELSYDRKSTPTIKHQLNQELTIELVAYGLCSSNDFQEIIVRQGYMVPFTSLYKTL